MRVPVLMPRLWTVARLGFLGATILAAGCATATPWQAPYTISSLQPVTPAAIQAATHKSVAYSGPDVLRLTDVSAPAWLDTDRYQYHLTYQNPQMLLAYRDARWVGTPAEMLDNRLLQALQLSGDWKAVLSGQSNGAAQWVLQVRLHNFVVNFTGPQMGQAEVSGTATLLGARGYQVVAQQAFHFSVPLQEASPAGGAAAMAQASAEFVAAVRGWTTARAQ